MVDEKKFLDQNGVEYLWSQLSLEDYPNNETLIAVLNAIDQTKADKDELFSGSWNDLEDKPFDEPCFYPVDILSVDTGINFNFKQASLELVLDHFNLYKTYKVIINGDEFIISNPTLNGTYRWGATNENFEDFPFYFTAAKEDFDMESGDFQFSRYNNYLLFTLPDEMYRNFEEAFHKEVQFYEEGLSKLDPKYLPEKYVTQEDFDAHTHSWESLKNKPFGETVIGNRIELSDFGEVKQTDSNSKRIGWMMNELNLYKKYIVKIREDEFIVSNPAYYDDGYYEHYIWGDSDYRDKTYENFPFMLYTDKYGYDENGDYHNYYVDFIWKDEAYPNLDPQTEVQIYGEGLSKIDPKYLPEDYVTQENFDAHTHSWNELEDKPFGENIKVMSPLTFVPGEEIRIFGDRLVTDLFIEGWNLHKAYKIVIREDEFIIRDYTLEISDYDFYIWGDFYYVNDLPFGFSALADDSYFDEDGNLLPSPYEDIPPRLIFSWNSTVYPDLDLATEVQIYAEGDEVSTIDPKYLPESIADKIYVDEQLATKANSEHDHNDLYYTEIEINNLLNEKVNISALNNYYTKTEVEQFHDEIKDYVDDEVTALVNSAPETLDTLGELAEAFQENEEVVDVLNEAIATKYSSSNPPPYPVTSVQGKTGDVNFTIETWTFTLTDGSTVTKKVLLG